MKSGLLFGRRGRGKYSVANGDRCRVHEESLDFVCEVGTSVKSAVVCGGIDNNISDESNAVLSGHNTYGSEGDKETAVKGRGTESKSVTVRYKSGKRM